MKSGHDFHSCSVVHRFSADEHSPHMSRIQQIKALSYTHRDSIARTATPVISLSAKVTALYTNPLWSACFPIIFAIKHKLLIIVIELPAPNRIAMPNNRKLERVAETLYSTSTQPHIHKNDPIKYSVLWSKNLCVRSMSSDDTNDAINDTIGTMAKCSTLV